MARVPGIVWLAFPPPMRKISSRLLAAGFALLLLRDGLSAAVNAEHESPHVPADRAAPDDVCGTDRHLMVADARPPRPAPRAVDAAEESGGTPARAAFAAPLGAIARRGDHLDAPPDQPLPHRRRIDIAVAARPLSDYAKLMPAASSR